MRLCLPHTNASKRKYNHPLICGGHVLRPLWMPETTGSPKPYVYYAFSYTYTPMMKFNLYIRHRKINNNN